jgi:alkylation response protein AidB-like acyl-CoA dehydrogenase
LRTPPIDAAPHPDPTWRDHWPALAELGVTAFCVAEEGGGFGREVAAAVVASRELGAALHGGPYAAVTAAAYALSRWLEPEIGTDATARILDGSEIPSLAFLDPRSTVVDDGDAMRVHGRARLVAGAADADALLVVPPHESTLVYVRAGDGCSVTSDHPFDVTRSCADVTFEGASGVPVRCGVDGRSQTERLHGLLLAADALGGVERMLERTTIYAGERVAFGRPIGGFQAVQHRLVDHALRVRAMALLVESAAEALTVELPDGGRAVLLAEASVSKHAVHVLHDLVQLTGAIGFTWEHGLHLYERRAHLDARLGRNPRRALVQIATGEGWVLNSPEGSSA